MFLGSILTKHEKHRKCVCFLEFVLFSDGIINYEASKELFGEILPRCFPLFFAWREWPTPLGFAPHANDFLGACH